MTSKYQEPRSSDDAAVTTERLLTTEDLADRWQVARGALEHERVDPSIPHPRFIKIGRRVRYRLSDVAAFEEGNAS